MHVRLKVSLKEENKMNRYVLLSLFAAIFVTALADRKYVCKVVRDRVVCVYDPSASS